MIIAILAGFLTGFFLAMPPGPVGVMAINMGVNKGSKAGTHLALGTGFMDFIFCVFAMSMATAVQAALGGFTDDYPNLYLFVQIAIIIALFIYGIFNVRKTDSQSGEVLQNPAEYSNSKIIRYLKNKGPFLLGIAIALTNIPNAYIFAFFDFYSFCCEILCIGSQFVRCKCYQQPNVFYRIWIR